jgi:aryl-alcohol dehydrogenase-like predicted oxidoreductase
MEYRQLSGAGLRVPLLSFGTATFGGVGDFFKAWGATDVAEAKRMVDLCMDHGVNFFDTANGYSRGRSEEILGEALKGKRHQSLIATKATFPMGDAPMDYGSSRFHLIETVEASLKRLQTDHIDMFFMHGQDMLTPVEETLRSLDNLITAGKIRYIGCSNFSGWNLMKSLSVSERHGWAKYVLNQTYYSLVGREYEWELMPLGLDQNVSSMVWSPLAGGALSGKISRTRPAPAGSRAAQMDFVVSSKSEHLHSIVDVLEVIAKETEKTVAQVALNWVAHRPTVANVVVGARNEEQLKQNFGAVGWKLSAEQVARLDSVSEVKPIYPYWHQRSFPQLQR